MAIFICSIKLAHYLGSKKLTKIRCNIEKKLSLTKDDKGIANNRCVAAETSKLSTANFLGSIK